MADNANAREGRVPAAAKPKPVPPKGSLDARKVSSQRANRAAPRATPATTVPAAASAVTPSSTDNPTIDAGEMAQNYGFALSFLNSDPELKKVFDQAVAGTWSNERFVAAIRNTAYYQKHSVTWRNAEILKKSDPASYASQIAQITAELSDRAATLGAPISWAQLQAMAENKLHLGWTDAQVADQMAGYVKAVNGVYNGAVGDDVGSLKETAWRNGIALSDTTIQSYATQIAKGSANRGFFEKTIRDMAKTAAPGYADQLDAGMNLYEIANPYMQSMARILEVNPQQLDLFDPTIRGALSATGADGKPSSKSLWQFENELRKDPRWLSTNNARDSMMGITHKVLTDMGFAW